MRSDPSWVTLTFDQKRFVPVLANGMENMFHPGKSAITRSWAIGGFTWTSGAVTLICAPNRVRTQNEAPMRHSPEGTLGSSTYWLFSPKKTR